MLILVHFGGFQFHTYAAPSEESYKEKWLRVDSRADDLERRLHNALQREKRTKLTALSLVEELKEKNMLTEDLQSRLDAYSGRPSINSLDPNLGQANVQYRYFDVVSMVSRRTVQYRFYRTVTWYKWTNQIAQLRQVYINKYFRKFCECIFHIVMFYKLCQVSQPHTNFCFVSKIFPSISSKRRLSTQTSRKTLL